MKCQRGLLLFLVMVVLGGCVTIPTGPTVRVMPGPGKPFEVFAEDDTICRQWAQQQVGGASPSETANQNLASGAVVGTLVGAGLGAAIGAATGNVGAGAAIGAGAGLLGGTSIGANSAYASGWELQRQYDIAYQQCMYAKGNQIPGVVRRRTQAYAPPPPPGAAIPNQAYASPKSPPPQPTRAAVLQPIYFDLNKSDIRSDAAVALKINLEWFRQNPGRKVSIEGNCDPRATEKYNLALGKKRADAAKKYLVGLGVDGALLETFSYGEDMPSCKENDESCWAQERRVEFKPMAQPSVR
jgi:outer membrane protein OmpA-like peptidoglycan-associated protein